MAKNMTIFLHGQRQVPPRFLMLWSSLIFFVISTTIIIVMSLSSFWAPRITSVEVSSIVSVVLDRVYKALLQTLFISKSSKYVFQEEDNFIIEWWIIFLEEKRLGICQCCDVWIFTIIYSWSMMYFIVINFAVCLL